MVKRVCINIFDIWLLHVSHFCNHFLEKTKPGRETDYRPVHRRARLDVVYYFQGCHELVSGSAAIHKKLSER